MILHTCRGWGSARSLLHYMKCVAHDWVRRTSCCVQSDQRHVTAGKKVLLPEMLRFQLHNVGPDYHCFLVELLFSPPPLSPHRCGACCCVCSGADQWASLCDALASRLAQTGMQHAASLCYICAGNVDQVGGLQGLLGPGVAAEGQRAADAPTDTLRRSRQRHEGSSGFAVCDVDCMAEGGYRGRRGGLCVAGAVSC